LERQQKRKAIVDPADAAERHPNRRMKRHEKQTDLSLVEFRHQGLGENQNGVVVRNQRPNPAALKTVANPQWCFPLRHRSRNRCD
jgi:hypothetical protein